MHKSAYNKSDNYNECGIKIYKLSTFSNKCVARNRCRNFDNRSETRTI